MTVWIAVTCPGCHSTDVIRNGKTAHGKQRYKCRNQECPRCTFIQDYTNQGYKPEVKRQIVDMSVNGSGVRDIARVLNISTSTVIKELKKRCDPAPPKGARELAPRQTGIYSRK